MDTSKSDGVLFIFHLYLFKTAYLIYIVMCSIHHSLNFAEKKTVIILKNVPIPFQAIIWTTNSYLASFLAIALAQPTRMRSYPALYKHCYTAAQARMKSIHNSTYLTFYIVHIFAL